MAKFDILIIVTYMTFLWDVGKPGYAMRVMANFLIFMAGIGRDKLRHGFFAKLSNILSTMAPHTFGVTREYAGSTFTSVLNLILLLPDPSAIVVNCGAGLRAKISHPKSGLLNADVNQTLSTYSLNYAIRLYMDIGAAPSTIVHTATGFPNHCLFDVVLVPVKCLAATCALYRKQLPGFGVVKLEF